MDRISDSFRKVQNACFQEGSFHLDTAPVRRQPPEGRGAVIPVSCAVCMIEETAGRASLGRKSAKGTGTVIYWAHEVVDLGNLVAGLGAAWDETGFLHTVSLNPDGEAARANAQKTIQQNRLSESSYPGNLLHELRAALHGEDVCWTWFPRLQTGTVFQERVWQELMHCPHGETWSYSTLARRLGQNGASRAVGNACGRNPYPLRVPCHRVIAANGSLGGFTGDLEVKRWLLRREATLSQDRDSSQDGIGLL